jgi:SAM-dependent methyltransferase
VEKDYRAHYRELFEKHWWWCARADAIVDLLRRRCPPQGWGAILDVGCGEGLFFDRLSQFGEVEGIDVPEALAEIPERHRERIHAGPFDESFRPGKQYSLVLMLDVLEHLADPLAALRRAVALLIPAGALLATVPAFRLLWTNHDVINHHRTRYNRSTFRPLARRAGLRIEEERYWFQSTCPAKLATRAIESLFRLPPRTPGIPPRWLNEVLYGLARLEQVTLGRIPCPFGSTLVVLGRKELA